MELASRGSLGSREPIAPPPHDFCRPPHLKLLSPKNLYLSPNFQKFTDLKAPPLIHHDILNRYPAKRAWRFIAHSQNLHEITARVEQ